MIPGILYTVSEQGAKVSVLLVGRIGKIGEKAALMGGKNRRERAEFSHRGI